MTDALKDLNEMIERIRAEADAAGYARAMADVTAFAQRSSRPKIPTVPQMIESLYPSAKTEKTPSGRTPRGRNQELVEMTLTDAGGPISVLDIKKAIDGSAATEGAIAYSSVQNALTQLELNKRAKRMGRGIWEHVPRDPTREEILGTNE